MVLDSSLVGLDHKERLFIAKSLYCRYRTYPDDKILAEMAPLLDEENARKAHIFGAAMRLARSISASCPGVLEHIPLKLTAKQISITFPVKFAQLSGETVEKRLKWLAEALGVVAKIRFER
jgi:exopolyphosphatase/guanosine-5'-triphosphate,3'-diphosphate pyrophosphatase